MPTEIYKRKPLTEEHKKNISLALKGKKKTLHHSINISKARKGKKLSEKTKTRISEACRDRVSSMKGKHHSEKSKKRMSEAHKGKHYSPKTEFKKGHNEGSNHPQWKENGRIKHSAGYIYIRKPSHPFANKQGYILEHRLVVEKQLGRYLRPEEVVHHINEIKDDNKLENLMLFKNQIAHHKWHMIQEGVASNEIIFDGKNF